MSPSVQTKPFPWSMKVRGSTGIPRPLSGLSGLASSFILPKGVGPYVHLAQFALFAGAPGAARSVVGMSAAPSLLYSR